MKNIEQKFGFSTNSRDIILEIEGFGYYRRLSFRLPFFAWRIERAKKDILEKYNIVKNINNQIPHQEHNN